MSKLEELIKEFCPNGVEYKKLGDVCIVETGGEPPKNSVKGKHPTGEYIYPIFSNGVGENALWGFSDSYRINIPSVTFSSIGTIGCPTLRETAFTPIIRLKVLYPKNNTELDVKFLKYALETVEFKQQKSSVPNINANMIKSIIIPLPALPVQREIVRILDSFTLYSAELTAELTARRKQYEFYRDKLLSFYSGNIQRVKLKDICGKVSNIKWQNDDNEYAYIDLSSVDRETHKITIEQRINKENAPSRAQQIVNKGDVLFATTRPTLKRYCKITEEFNGQICSTGFVVLRPKINIILSTYLYYIVSSDRFFTYVEKNQEGTSYPAISDSKVKEFDFSLPPIEVQERIVKVLDKFDSICNDLSAGLPAEIEKRQKQYEYYRDKLLRF